MQTIKFSMTATKEFIRTKSTNNTRAMTAPPDNNQWSYLYMSTYMSIQDYSILFFSELEKNIVELLLYDILLLFM